MTTKPADYDELEKRLREDAGLAGWDILDEAADAIAALRNERDDYKQGRDLQSAVATAALDERDGLREALKKIVALRGRAGMGRFWEQAGEIARTALAVARTIEKYDGALAALAQEQEP